MSMALNQTSLSPKISTSAHYLLDRIIVWGILENALKRHLRLSGTDVNFVAIY